MIRKILAVVGGIMAASVCIWMMESIGHALYPLSKDTANDVDAFKKYVETLPFMALLLVILGYALGAFVAGFISTKIAKDGKNVYAIICGIFFLLATIYNMVVLPTPIWFWMLGVAVWGLVLVGHKLALNKI
ncbi:hypothetical protein D1631_09035 [Chryseobacterium nematophagum]|uniref:Uncharacterized protein n=1 Tax=Chryseobacterium nematophagum TaxID=2305228 RepID=A0A3M7TGF8_9FLAO|nr:hypothetical protein [Chryseobacterium nematophagum]RNA62066.1 hypothetical protein D1631_09035 [Chryseobacterium nematophagum]